MFVPRYMFVNEYDHIVFSRLRTYSYRLIMEKEDAFAFATSYTVRSEHWVHVGNWRSTILLEIGSERFIKM